MRLVSLVIGIIALGIGIYVLAARPTYKTTETAAKLGPLTVQTTHDKPVPQWTGIAGVVIGGLLLVGAFAGGRKR